MAIEDILLKQMPHSLEGEQAVLGSMLIDPDCVKDVMDKLCPSDFYLRQNREIFETIYSMFTYAKPIDGITVCEEMRRVGTYDEQTTRSYLAQLMEITPTSANVMEYAAIVQDKALLPPWPRRRGRSPPWSRRAWARPGRSWRRRSRKSTPSAGAGAPRRWCPWGRCSPTCWTASVK